MRELKIKRWRRIKNPQPNIWPGPWIEWRSSYYETGAASLGNVHKYLPNQAAQIRAAIAAGKRGGKL